MKKTTYLVILLLAMVTTACGSASNSNRTNRNFGSQTGATAAELPATTQLLIGTLKLEGTDQVVTAKQAADLLPLWQTMKVLSESDTAAQQEKDALISQIQETMTPKQVQTITDMKLTRADMFTFLQGTGNNPTSSQNSNSQNRSSSGNNIGRGNGQGGGGFFPGGGGGGFPGGGGGFGGQGQNLNPQQIATAQASRQQRNGNSLPPALINALIDYLQKKAGT